MQPLRRCRWRALIVLALGLLATPALAQPDDAAFAERVQRLNADSFPAKSAAAAAVAESGHPRAEPVLRALAEGRLFFRVRGGEVVIARETEDGYALTDPVTGEAAGEATRYEVRRVVINNAIRGEIRDLLAVAGLNSPDRATRERAVDRLLSNPSREATGLIRAAIEDEPDAGIRATMAVALALSRLESEDPAVRMEAVGGLEGALQDRVRNRLREVAAGDPDGAVQRRAADVLAGIEAERAWWGLAEQVFFGLSMGSVLMLAAFGLAITFGVMGVINMAHGELIMIGAYTTYVVQQLMPDHVDLSILVAIPAAFLVAGAFGVAIERGVIRFLYGRPLETLLATFGLSLVLQQLVRTVFSPLNRQVSTPSWMSGALELNPVFTLTLNRLYVIAFALVVFFVLIAVFKRTTLGLRVRAVSQNRAMARAVGVSSARVDALTFGLGAGVAGLAGVALSQLTNVGPNLGQGYIIDSFLVVVFGGVGNLWGTLVGGLSLGVLNKFLEPQTGAVLAKVLVLVFIILFIQKRPQGLFPQRGRAAAEG